MGLFSDPLVLVDAGTNNRTFNFRTQLIESNTVGAEYTETAAEIASFSKLVVKHTTSSKGLKRHLLQRAETFDLTDDPSDGDEAVVVNVTISHNPHATEAQIQNQLTLVIDAMLEANFVKYIMREML